MTNTPYINIGTDDTLSHISHHSASAKSASHQGRYRERNGICITWKLNADFIKWNRVKNNGIAESTLLAVDFGQISNLVGRSNLYPWGVGWEGGGGRGQSDYIFIHTHTYP